MNLNKSTKNIAAIFAKIKHQGQFRSGTETPYVQHVFNIVDNISTHKHELKDLDLDFLSTIALLHDTIEDTNTSYEEVLQVFGEEIADAVLALTKNDNLPHEKQLPDSLERILQQPKEVAVVKMLDRIDNISTINPIWTKQKSLQYVDDSKLILDSLKSKNAVIARLLESEIYEYEQKINIKFKDCDAHDL